MCFVLSQQIQLAGGRLLVSSQHRLGENKMIYCACQRVSCIGNSFSCRLIDEDLHSGRCD